MGSSALDFWMIEGHFVRSAFQKQSLDPRALVLIESEPTAPASCF